MLFQRPKDPFRSSTTSTQLGLKTFSRLSMPMAPILALDTSRLEKPLSASKTRSARLLAWHQSKEAVDEGLAEVLVDEITRQTKLKLADSPRVMYPQLTD